MIPVLEKHSGMKAGDDFLVAYSPERVKANLVLERLGTTPKVVGGLDTRSRAAAISFYRDYLRARRSPMSGPLKLAEMTKLLGMLYRDVNIALANELADSARWLVSTLNAWGRCEQRWGGKRTGSGHRSRRSLHAGLSVFPDPGVSAPWDDSTHLGSGAGDQRWAARPGSSIGCRWRGREVGGNESTSWAWASGRASKWIRFSPAYALRAELEMRQAVVTMEDPTTATRSSRAPVSSLGMPADATPRSFLNTAHPQFATSGFRGIGSAPVSKWS